MDERQADHVVDYLKEIRWTLEKATTYLGYITYLLAALIVAVLAVAFKGAHF